MKVRTSLVLMTIAAVVALAAPSSVWAAEFQVQPTTVELAGPRGARSSGSVTVTNRSSEPVRFQVRVMAWDQSVDGQMLLAPTTDVVAYPTLFTIDPGGSRAVRVAAAVDPLALERSYRVFVEELPPLRRADDATAPGIKVLTRMGIPIFVAPATVRVAGRVDASVVDDDLTVRIRNQGSVRVRIATVRVVAGRRNGVVDFDRSAAGWYLLAGGDRAYEMELGLGACPSVDWIRIEVTTDRGVWRRTVSIAPRACHGTP